MLKAIVFVFTLVSAVSLYDTNLSQCASMDKDTVLDNDSETCLKIIKDNISLDCKNFALKGMSANNYGIIISSVSGVNVNNCIIKNFNTGIFLNNSSATIESMKAENYMDIFLLNSSAILLNSSYKSAHLENSELWRRGSLMST